MRAALPFSHAHYQIQYFRCFLSEFTGMASQVVLMQLNLVLIGDRAMSMGNTYLVEVESINYCPEPEKEYRIKDEKVEARVLDRGSARDAVWRPLSPEQLSSHVRRNTAVARWLEQRLRCRRLLRACIGQQS